MRLGDLWAKHGGGTLRPDTAATHDLFIFGITEDSRDVRYGYLFCALPGTTVDGLAFCAQAAARGAQAIAVPEGTRDEALGLNEYGICLSNDAPYTRQRASTLPPERYGAPCLNRS